MIKQSGGQFVVSWDRFKGDIVKHFSKPQQGHGVPNRSGRLSVASLFDSLKRRDPMGGGDANSNDLVVTDPNAHVLVVPRPLDVKFLQRVQNGVCNRPRYVTSPPRSIRCTGAPFGMNAGDKGLLHPLA